MSRQPTSGSGYNRTGSNTPNSHPSLPARPPPSANNAPFHYSGNPSTGQHGSRANNVPNSYGGAGAGAFRPRNVAGSQTNWSSQSTGSQAPGTGYAGQHGSYAGSGYQSGAHGQQQQYYPQGGNDPYAQQMPQIQNPFPLPGQNRNQSHSNDPNYDPEYEAQLAQWQSAYTSKEDSTTGKTNSGRGLGPSSAGGANAVPLGKPVTVTAKSNVEITSAAKLNIPGDTSGLNADDEQLTVVRSGGGKTWEDSTLLEWDPSHFRIFVGNLAGEVTDESLYKAFSRYPSIQKTRVVRDKRTTKSLGYGFVSFSSGTDYFQAAKEMQGKYIGSHPVTIQGAKSDVKPQEKKKNNNYNKNNKNNKNKHGSGGAGAALGPQPIQARAKTGAGITKKPTKTKNGIRFLG